MDQITEKEFEKILRKFIKSLELSTIEERKVVAGSLHELQNSMESDAGKSLTEKLENYVRYGSCEKPENEGAGKWSRENEEKSNMTVK